MGNIMKLHFKPNKLWYAIYSTSMTFTWLMSSSVVQASDLQIYASPTAGKKNNCYDARYFRINGAYDPVRL